MKLNPSTKIHDLLEAYPFLLDFFAAYCPKFAILKNRAMRATMGRMATLSMAASMGDIPLETFMRDIAAEIKLNTAERIFPRSPGVVGRKVQHCHPPKSLHVVNRIIEEFRAGTRHTADFWIQTGSKFVFIRYVAVIDKQGTYRGTMEIIQDITSIRKLEGEQRLLDRDGKN